MCDLLSLWLWSGLVVSSGDGAINPTLLLQKPFTLDAVLICIHKVLSLLPSLPLRSQSFSLSLSLSFPLSRPSSPSLTHSTSLSLSRRPRFRTGLQGFCSCATELPLHTSHCEMVSGSLYIRTSHLIAAAVFSSLPVCTMLMPLSLKGKDRERDMCACIVCVCVCV